MESVLKFFICAYELASKWGRSVRFTNDMLGHGTIMNAGAAVVEGLLADLDEEDFVNYLMTCEVLPEVSTWQSVFEGSAIHDYYPGNRSCKCKKCNVYGKQQCEKQRRTYKKCIWEDNRHKD